MTYLIFDEKKSYYKTVTDLGWLLECVDKILVDFSKTYHYRFY